MEENVNLIREQDSILRSELKKYGRDIEFLDAIKQLTTTSSILIDITEYGYTDDIESRLIESIANTKISLRKLSLLFDLDIEVVSKTEELLAQIKSNLG